MVIEQKEIFNVEYEILTPVSIGNGIKIAKTELGLFSDQEFIRKINLDSFFETIPATKIGQITEKIKHSRNDYLNNILKNEKITLDTLIGEYDLSFLYRYSHDDLLKLREIISFIKTPFSRPYLPGSSIKGWLRTAMLYYYLKTINETNQNLDKLDSKFRQFPSEKKQMFKKKLEMHNIVEDDIFGRDPKEDIFKYITISDTESIDPTHLKLGQVLIFHPAESGGKIEFKSLGFPIYTELLNKGVKLSGRITLTKDLNAFKKEFLRSDSYSAKIRRAILNHFFEKSREEIISNFCTINNYFTKKIINFNFKYLQTINNTLQSRILEHLIDFYKGTLLSHYKRIKSEKNQFLIRLGYGTEWHSKTIGLALMDYYLEKKNLPFSQFFDLINQAQLFNGKKMHKKFELTPISRAYITDTLRNPQYPLGWIKVTINP